MMRPGEFFMDLRLWIAIAIVLSLIIPEADLPVSSILIVILMVQMTFSMDGLKLSLQDMKDNRKGALISILLCYGLNTLITLLVGLIFLKDNEAIWYGWVMLASMPCAIAVVSTAILTMERVEVSVIAVTATYLSGIILTPVLSFILIGDAVNPLEILKYIVLFIVVPVILSRFTPYLKISRSVKVPVINLMMALLMFFSVNSNATLIQSDPGLIAAIFGGVMLRIVTLHIIMTVLLKKTSFGKGSDHTYLVLGVWKNTGLSVSMAMVLLEPSAVIPCFMCLIVESIWFSIVTKMKDDGVVVYSQ